MLAASVCRVNAETQLVNRFRNRFAEYTQHEVWRLAAFIKSLLNSELFYLCMEDMDTGREALASNLVMDAIVYRCLEIAVDAVGCLDADL